MVFVRSFYNWLRYQSTVKALNRLSSYELRDIGLSRLDIPTIARKSIDF